MFFGYQTSTGDLGAGPGSQEWLWFRGSAGACSTLRLRLPFPISALCLADNNTCWKKSGTAQYICHLSQSLSQPFCSANGCSPFLGGFRDKGSCGVCSWLEDVQLLEALFWGTHHQLQESGLNGQKTDNSLCQNTCKSCVCFCCWFVCKSMFVGKDCNKNFSGSNNAIPQHSGHVPFGVGPAKDSCKRENHLQHILLLSVLNLNLKKTGFLSNSP